MKIKNFKKFVRSILIILGIIFILSLIIVKSTLSYTNNICKIWRYPLEHSIRYASK